MIKRLIMLIGCCLTAVTGFADQTAQIAGSINNLIYKTNPKINMGIIVKDLDTDKILFQRNPDKTFVPASNLKLYSNATALMVLGPNYHFSTALYTDGAINSGTMQGNLYLKFNGDPSLTHSDVENLIAQLRSMGINRINGNVYVVPANYTNQPYGPGWILKDTALYYGAPVSPVIVDENRVKIIVMPGGNGAPAHVSVDEPSGVIKIENNIRTTDKRGCVVGEYVDSNNAVRVNGCVHTRRGASSDELALKNPLLYAQNLARVLLKNQGIAVSGQVTSANLPHNVRLIAIHQSDTLSQLMVNTLKPSDNLYADSLYLKSAEMYLNQTATWSNAADTLKKVLQQYAGVNLNKAVIVDGCGLSRYNLITPNQTLNLLIYLYRQFPLRYEFMTALPVGGRDGTLKKRMRSSAARGRVRAKTGAMTGVASLSGYVESANHHTLAFSIMINRVPGDGSWGGAKYRHLEDQICEYLMQLSPEGRVLTQNALQSHQLLPYANKRLS